MNDIENESEEAQVSDFEDEIEKKIEINREKVEECPEENLKAVLFKDFEEQYF